jgi:hypothetical protein
LSSNVCQNTSNAFSGIDSELSFIGEAGFCANELQQKANSKKILAIIFITSATFLKSKCYRGRQFELQATENGFVQ